MCGRFTLTIADFEQLVALLGVEADKRMAPNYRRRFNVPPSDTHWIVTPKGDTQRAILPARWGFGRSKLPLARGETVTTNNMFKGAFAERRCIIPTSGFFEWTGEKGARKPHWFHPRDPDELVLLGGVYREGSEGFAFAIVTTAANEVVRPVHDRMPVIVAKKDVDRWLRGSEDAAEKLIHPAPKSMLIDTEVSTRVNAAVNDDEECLAPVEQRRLF
jgi:putative SOS response-associated peptidase YedK